MLILVDHFAVHDVVLARVKGGGDLIPAVDERDVATTPQGQAGDGGVGDRVLVGTPSLTRTIPEELDGKGEVVRVGVQLPKLLQDRLDEVHVDPCPPAPQRLVHGGKRVLLPVAPSPALVVDVQIDDRVEEEEAPGSTPTAIIAPQRVADTETNLPFQIDSLMRLELASRELVRTSNEYETRTVATQSPTHL